MSENNKVRDTLGENRDRSKCLSVINYLEQFFYWYGLVVARRPLAACLACLLLCAVCSLGLIHFRQETDPERLWLPRDSDFVRNSNWMKRNFPQETRLHSVIVEADNVLTPAAVKHLLRIHQTVQSIRTLDGSTWDSKCYRIPVVTFDPVGVQKAEETTTEARTLLSFSSGLDDDDADADGAGDDDDDYTYDYWSFFNFTQGQEEAAGDSHDDANGTTAMTTTTIATISTVGTGKNNATEGQTEFDPSVDLYPSEYCDILSQISVLRCFENSLLELWATDNYGVETVEKIQSLSQQEIIDMVNEGTYSEVFHRTIDPESFLGGIQRNSSGHIVAAKAMNLKLFGRIDLSAASVNGDEEDGGIFDQPVDASTLRFESALLQSILAEDIQDVKGIVTQVSVARSFNDLAEQSISSDIPSSVLGCILIVVYAQIMLGKFNSVQQRPLLSCAGVVNVYLSVLASYGICLFLGLVFGPMHNIIPFIILGIGIDDMFVIVQSLDNLPDDDDDGGEDDAKAAGAGGLGEDSATLKAKTRRKVEERIGRAMKHAGVAITLTSVTDVFVFAIGATSALPALRSFCLYSSLGILFVYVLQATLFVAALTLDELRQKTRRNGCLVCYQHDPYYKPNAFSRRNWLRGAFKSLGKTLLQPVGKFVVLMMTAVFLAFGIFGLTLLKQESNVIWFIPPTSHLRHWFDAQQEFFPRQGEQIIVHVGNINYSQELWKLDKLAEMLHNETQFVSSVESWYEDFKAYLERNHIIKDFLEAFHGNETEFSHRLTQFLFSPSGAKHQTNIRFGGDLSCGFEAPEVLMTKFHFTHQQFPGGSSQHIAAMHKAKSIVSSLNFSSSAFPLGQAYANWEMDDIITRETTRNMALAFVFVLVTTAVLTMNTRACGLVSAAVLLTLVNVSGFMHFWGLTIDVISCVNLVISVGLCVDYSMHIAHAFMINRGTKNARSLQALTEIGPAVFNGGFSTFVAFFPLVTSQSHVFTTFFKILFLVVMFGLFHGLIFLPVALSLVGPAERDDADTDADADINNDTDADTKSKADDSDNVSEATTVDTSYYSYQSCHL